MVDITKYVEGQTLSPEIVLETPMPDRLVSVLPGGHGFEMKTDRNGMAYQRLCFPVMMAGLRYVFQPTPKVARAIGVILGSKETDNWVNKSFRLNVKGSAVKYFEVLPSGKV